MINISPLLFLKNNRLLGYKNGSVYIIDTSSFEIVDKFQLFHSFKEFFLYRFKLIRRLLRLGIRTIIQLSDEEILIFANKKIYELNISTKRLSSGYIPDEGVRALYFTEIESIEGFDNSLVFGGYLSNSQKKSVHIYKRIEQDKWEIIYTFENGQINHVHNIIPDKYNQCVWIFTGDFDEASAIWKATDNFNKVERVLSNHQIYRGCIGFPTKEGLIYATDTPFYDNTIRILKKIEDRWISDKICNIEGSSIYGCQYKDMFVFSTTVEPDGRDSSLYKLLFSKKRGVGIKDNYTHLYIGSYEEEFEDRYKLKKDIWPYIFQFGTIKFPIGKNQTDYLIFEPVATSKHNLQMIKFKI